jgi:hypothetical protein
LQHDFGNGLGHFLFGYARRGDLSIFDLDSVFRGLCVTLASGHNLRSLQVDITGDKTEYILSTVPHLFLAAELLGNLKELDFKGDLSSYSPRPTPPKPDCLNDALRAAWTRLGDLVKLGPTHEPIPRRRKPLLHNVASGYIQVQEHLPHDARVAHMRRSLLDLAKKARHVAVRLRKVYSFARGQVLFGQAPYAVVLHDFISSHVDLQAAEYQIARDRSKQVELKA